jgi:hypothetical protein
MDGRWIAGSPSSDGKDKGTQRPGVVSPRLVKILADMVEYALAWDADSGPTNRVQSAEKFEELEL